MSYQQQQQQQRVNADIQTGVQEQGSPGSSYSPTFVSHHAEYLRENKRGKNNCQMKALC